MKRLQHICINCVHILFALWCIGCASPLHELRSELRSGGWDLWYPAEAEVEPGDIWGFSNGRRDLIAKRPAAIKLLSERPVAFRAIASRIDVTTDVQGGTRLGPLSRDSASGAILSKSAKAVELDFGSTSVIRVALEEFAVSRTDLPQEYSRALAEIRKGSTDKTLITSVVRTKGLKYIVTASREFDARIAADAIAMDLKAKVGVSMSENDKYIFTIDEGQALAIGAGELASSMFLRDPMPERGESGSAPTGREYLLRTVDVWGSKEMPQQFARAANSAWFRIEIPKNVRAVRVVVRESGGSAPEFDIVDFNRSGDYVARGLRSQSRLLFSESYGRDVYWMIVDVRYGSGSFFKVDFIAEE